MSPSFALRAPLLWLLIPFMTGVSCARVWAAASAAMLPALGVALLGCAVAALRWRGCWSAGMTIAAGVAGWLWLPLRSPVASDWDGPPREIEVTIQIEQIFATAPHRTTAGGIATIVEADGPFAGLVGQRIHYSLIRRISIVPVASGTYLLRGVMKQLPANPSAAGFESYLANLGIQFEVARAQLVREVAPPTRFQRFCTRAQERLARILGLGVDDHPAAVSIYLGMLLGQKADLSPAQERAFMQTGVFHVFSISGLHVGVIAIAIQSALQLLRVPQRVAVATALPVLWLYVQVSGGSTPAERAFLMIAFMQVAKVARLPGNPLAALAAAALLTLLIDPRQLFTAGFQMSYGVVTALVVMGMPLGMKWQAAWQPWRSLPEADWKFYHRAIQSRGASSCGAIAVSGVALIASIPAGIGYFEMISPGSIIANLVIIPLSGLAIVAGFVSMLSGICGFEAGSLFVNHSAVLVITVMEWLVRMGAELPGMYFVAQFKAPWLASPAQALVLGSMLLGAAFRWDRKVGGFWLPLIAVTVLLLTAVEYP